MEIKTQKDLLQEAIKLEKQAQDVYSRIACLFRYNQDICIIFNELAEDEKKHARILASLLGELSEATLNLPSPFQHSEKIKSISQDFKHIDIEEIKHLNDAYEIAHELEFSELNSIFLQIILLCSDDEDEHNFIKQEIIAHQKKIFSLKTKFGNKLNRMAYPAIL